MTVASVSINNQRSFTQGFYKNLSVQTLRHKINLCWIKINRASKNCADCQSEKMLQEDITLRNNLPFTVKAC